MSNLEIAHICALKRGGPRYDPAMTDADRNAFSNLLLLCHPHHVFVDRLEWRAYSVETLRQWKDRRELGGRAELEGLRGITEDRLQDIFVDVIDARDKKLLDALARFEEIDSEAARVLRDLIARLDDAGLVSGFLDVDTVTTLNSAAQQLRDSMDADIATRLYQAAVLLDSSLNQDVVSNLHAAANKIENLPNMIDTLQGVLSDLRQRMPPM
jgi:hypothetical protein